MDPPDPAVVDVAFILFPVCRNFISLLRRTPLNDIVPFDKNITFHSESEAEADVPQPCSSRLAQLRSKRLLLY